MMNRNNISKGWKKINLTVPSIGPEVFRKCFWYSKRSGAATLIGGALLAGCLAAVAQEAAPVAVEKTPAQKLVDQARAERAAGNPKQAIQTAAEVLILGQIDKETLAQCELLIAELYLEQGLTNAASVVARQIPVLHEGSEVVKKADALKFKIDDLKKVEESK